MKEPQTGVKNAFLPNWFGQTTLSVSLIPTSGSAADAGVLFLARAGAAVGSEHTKRVGQMTLQSSFSYKGRWTRRSVLLAQMHKQIQMAA